MTKILITGGAGFIGLKLVKHLLLEQENCHITVVDNLHPQVHGPNAKVPLELQNRSVDFFKTDIRDGRSLSKIIKKAHPEIVYHLASETGTGQSYDEVVRYSQVNVVGTAILLHLLKTYAPMFRKIILASSRAVYGEGAWADQNSQRVFPSARPIEDMKCGQFFPRIDGEILTNPLASQENDPPSPSSIYASTKLMQEYFVIQALAGSQARATILRFQNVYGPGQSMKNPYTGVLSIFSKQILAGEKINIYEDGTIVRDFVYVDDVVRAFTLAINPTLPHGLILNIGSNERTTILFAAQRLLEFFGSPSGFCISGQYRVGDIRHALADTTQAFRTLGWSPSISFQVGLCQFAQSISMTKLTSSGLTG
ncbi:MAG: NAD-dependent epimerase/dehydratase family protein [Bdellovibrionales bacterium]|jgi:dTDP-L-rhamnose 4-epimerase|nr:NAD-dependent epimerase/dehydratase family protein [Bdellovibrionales bacterium]